MLIELIENYCFEHSESIYLVERAAKIPNGTIGKWKNKKRKPSLEVLIKLGNYTHIPLSKLIDAWENDYGKSDEKHN